MAAKVYPDWVQKHRRKGTTVKRVGDNYYLYKHTSKRVPGKKNPVPVDSYIGRITPDGVEEKGYRKVDTNRTDVIVKEYGFSRAVEILCPPEWKKIQGDQWQQVLDYIICRQSPESYIRDVREVPDTLDPHVQYGAQTSSLSRRLEKKYGTDLKDLQELLTIYLVRIGETRLISKISDEQNVLLKKLAIHLEV